MQSVAGNGNKGKREHRTPPHRHLYKMKSRTIIFTAIILLILPLCTAVFVFHIQKPNSAEFFAATIYRDCAPWDGAAFTVSIPYNPGGMIQVSIWQSPDIKHPYILTFPNATGRTGNANYSLRFSNPVPLTGNVFFWHIDEESPVEGHFGLITEAGERFNGWFKAEWEHKAALCG
jgi:hypothetical protein